jgi:DNA-binding LytR/AlgR family response regulator
MIRVLIIEDELPARKKILSFLAKSNQNYTIVAEIERVGDLNTILKNEKDIDVIFSDIELRDGNVFDYYKENQVQTPIIFVTAYDEFWMDAFESNGIDYLLKPFSYKRFEKALFKLIRLKEYGDVTKQEELFRNINYYLNTKEKPTYQKQIGVKNNSEVYFIQVQDIMYLQVDDGVIFAFDKKQKRHCLSQVTLKEVEELLDPEVFFKINRGELVNRNYIEKLSRYTKNKQAIHINGVVLKTSQKNTAGFNKWMGL